MSTTIVTADLSKFGFRELKLSSELLDAYIKQGADFLYRGVTLNFNTHSGYLFLSDEDYNIAMLDEGELKQWFFCHECGVEGFDGFDEESQLCGSCCRGQSG